MISELKLVRRMTAPVRRLGQAEEGMDEYIQSQPRKKLIVVIGDGYHTGENYVKKVASSMLDMAGLYGDDVIMAYNSYKRAMKAKQNGNIPNSGAVRTTETTRRRNSI